MSDRNNVQLDDQLFQNRSVPLAALLTVLASYPDERERDPYGQLEQGDHHRCGRVSMVTQDD
jgi:hypothetical protein